MESSQVEMNESKNIDIDFSDQEKYSDEYLNQLILLSFSYFDHHIDKDKYQRGLEKFTSNFGSIIKPQLIKVQLKYLIDFIDKYSNADGKFIENFLLNIKLKKEMIDVFIQKICDYNERIELFKNAMFEKLTNHRIINFSHSFKVKFIDSQNNKINFVINILIKYLDDNDEEKELEMELTLNQFYSVYEQFQRIDTLVKTLI
jgi:hypothetical protein